MLLDDHDGDVARVGEEARADVAAHIGVGAGEPVPGDPRPLTNRVEAQVLLEAQLGLDAEIRVHAGEDDDDPVPLVDCLGDQAGEIGCLPGLHVPDDEALAAVPDSLGVRASRQDPLGRTVDRFDGGPRKPALFQTGSVVGPFADLGLGAAIPVRPAAILADEVPDFDAFHTIALLILVGLEGRAETRKDLLDERDRLTVGGVLIEVSGAGFQYPLVCAESLLEPAIIQLRTSHPVPPFLLDLSTDHRLTRTPDIRGRSEEHTSELQSRGHLVCRLLLEKKKDARRMPTIVEHLNTTRENSIECDAN